MKRFALPFLLALCGVTLAGCLDKLGIEELWTRVDLTSASVSANQAFVAGAPESIAVDARITYRAIVTGFAVAELRASSTLSAADVDLRPNASRAAMARDVDRVLASSVSVGRATRAVTGWDHLIQTIGFRYTAVAPASLDTSGATTGLFLVCYLGSGQRIELADGTDSLAITPFNSTDYQLLPVGIELALASPVASRGPR
jgi:hypothetical protein